MKIENIIRKYLNEAVMQPSDFGKKCEIIFRNGDGKDWHTAAKMLYSLCEREPYNSEFYIDAFCMAYERARK